MKNITVIDIICFQNTRFARIMFLIRNAVDANKKENKCSHLLETRIYNVPNPTNWLISSHHVNLGPRILAQANHVILVVSDPFTLEEPPCPGCDSLPPVSQLMHFAMSSIVFKACCVFIRVLVESKGERRKADWQRWFKEKMSTTDGVTPPISHL